MAEIRKNQNDATKRTDEATGADGVRRVADEFGRVFGLTGQNEDLTRQATQNLEAITQTGSVLARGFQELSREGLDLLPGRVQKNARGVTPPAQSRTPPAPPGGPR